MKSIVKFIKQYIAPEPEVAPLETNSVSKYQREIFFYLSYETSEKISWNCIVYSPDDFIKKREEYRDYIRKIKSDLEDNNVNYILIGDDILIPKSSFDSCGINYKF